MEEKWAKGRTNILFGETHKWTERAHGNGNPWPKFTALGTGNERLLIGEFSAIFH
jgi:hypothetical protein